MFPYISFYITNNIISLHDINLDKAVEIGIKFLFEANWPEGFLYLGLQASPGSMNIKDILVHELAPFATAMFDSPFETKINKSKCNFNIILRNDKS